MMTPLRPRTVLVTGATGFVGSAIVRALRQHGTEVVGLVRDAKKAAWIEALGARIAVGDMLAPDSYTPLIPDVDAVIQAAQYGTTGRFTRKTAKEINYADETMSLALARACIAHGKRLLQLRRPWHRMDHRRDLVHPITARCGAHEGRDRTAAAP